MMFGNIRFVANGWIERLYVEPKFFFKYFGLGWVQPLDETGMYIVFIILIISAFLIMVGLFYRVATIVFFLLFAYVELIDATNYLNHYYLVCLLSFLLIFLPANRAFSLDARLFSNIKSLTVPAWTIYIIIFQLVVVYTYAGVAKLNGDWLFRAMPLAIWLPERMNIPILGYFFQFQETAYLFCWFGAIYDLMIGYFMLFRNTRPIAYVAVVVFHAMTGLLFNIGLFPVIMIFSTLIFFSADFHHRLLGFIGYKGTVNGGQQTVNGKMMKPFILRRQLLTFLLGIYIAIQLLVPLRHFLYNGNVLWTEEGYRLSWRVMVLEKSGQATFRVEDLDSGRKTEIINGYYLTLFQEKQMCIQPDFIIQFAHFLKKEFREKHGMTNIKITVDSHVVMNGRTSQRFINPDVNLAEVPYNLKKKDWVLPFKH